MTERFSGFVVALDKDIREDDAEMIINAIRLLKGVISVQPVGDDPKEDIAKARIKRSLQSRFDQIIEEL